MRISIHPSLALLLAACPADEPPSSPAALDRTAATQEAPDTASEETALATFAGGCFWCMEAPFEKVPGVCEVVSGYAGGHVEDPTYEEVCSGTTGHTESIQVHYDPARLSYADLLQIFWRQFDPTDAGGSFYDRGSQYRSEIFVHDEEQRAAALRSKAALDESGRFDDPIVTAVTPLERFWPAEEYHQDYYEKEPERYRSYRKGSGRDRFLDRVWGDEREWKPRGPSEQADAGAPWTDFEKPADDVLRERLTSLQYRVTQEEGTERPFQNEYWDNKEPGLYVDVVSGEPLFSSLDKYVSGTGWPSFTRPVPEAKIVEHSDRKLGTVRTEVRSGIADSHLGHVFDDGPAPTGLRYCINSAALRFVPADELESTGYEAFAERFAEADEDEQE